MTAFNFFSHGTQDIYPMFLKVQHHFNAHETGTIAIIYNIGAILGGWIFGTWSQTLGRRRTIMLAAILSLPVAYLWAYSTTIGALAIGAFLMQVCVQGAWGVIPAHLNELSPDAVRSLFPGFIYQLGVLFGSPTNTIEYALRDRVGYQWALTIFEGCTIVALMIVFALGPERKGKDFFRKTLSPQDADTTS